MKQIEKRKRSVRMNHKAKKGEISISLQGKGGDKDSILEQARLQCLQAYLEDGIHITEKVLNHDESNKKF